MRQIALCCLLLTLVSLGPSQEPNVGYFRFPAIHGQNIVFTAEGDLWTVGVDGGTARRLTTNPGQEVRAAFSPDGATIAFSASYEGPTEVYTMPAAGGLPKRRTFDGGTANVTGWTPDGRILYSTRRFSGLPDMQLAAIDADNQVELIPLSQASQGSYDRQGKTLYFTRLPFQGSYSKRYQGGTAQNLWKYAAGQEAIPLTGNYAGTSKNAMWWNGRVYFLSDRDGAMNLWSMDENGKDLKQHTRHASFDIKDASLSEGRIAYQMGADLRVYDIASGADRAIPIQLSSDFDHLREHWVNKPIEYATSAHVSPDGASVALTSRGRVFVAPVKNGRFVNIDERKPGRFRDARFLDAKTLLLLSSETGEVEFWKTAANGAGTSEQLTTGGKVLRWEGVPSPDGKWVANQDKDGQLWLLNLADKSQKKVTTALAAWNSRPLFEDVRWSADSRWLSFACESPSRNGFSQIFLYSLESGAGTPLTTDRYDSHSASWSSDGKWVYFISDRALKTQVMQPFGVLQPEPYYEKTDKIYMLALQKGQRSPFEPPDELHPDKPEEPAKAPADAAKPVDAAKTPADAAKPAEKKMEIDLNGIAARLQEVPVPAGSYSDLAVAGDRLCWLDHSAAEGKMSLQCLDIANKGDKPDTLMEDVGGFEVSADGKHIMVRRQNDLYVVAASSKGAALKDAKALADSAVDLKSWTFSVIPRDEFREAFVDAWRLHRDYFYDPNMHGVDWNAMRDKYAPLVERVRDREELNDLLSEMVGELSALHTFVQGGDIRRAPDQIQLASLGARLERDKAAGGYVVRHVFQSDPDRPDRQAPLARPGVDVAEGDVLLAINGRSLLSAEPGELLRNEAGKQVLLRVKPKDAQEPRDAIVKPISTEQESELRYHEWEYTRRLAVEKASEGRIGYVHLRSMGGRDIDQWMEQYLPVFPREGLIVDVRHNTGGNIDSWILDRLMRKAWMYWQPRVGIPTWNMQEAFRGHMVVLCDQDTASDGEAFSEGFRELGLGKLIGMRTWGGEIWLTGSNVLADQGVATAAENGVFGPDHNWLIEGRGVEPDIVVDNLPHATFEGQDAQLEAAIQRLKDLIREKPIENPAPPKYPNKSFQYPPEPPAKKK